MYLSCFLDNPGCNLRRVMCDSAEVGGRLFADYHKGSGAIEAEEEGVDAEFETKAHCRQEE